MFGRPAGFNDGLELGEFLLHEELRALDRLQKRHLPVHVLRVAVFLLVELHQIDVRKLRAGFDVLREVTRMECVYCFSGESDASTSDCRPAFFPPATN